MLDEIDEQPGVQQVIVPDTGQAPAKSAPAAPPSAGPPPAGPPPAAPVAGAQPTQAELTLLGGALAKLFAQGTGTTVGGTPALEAIAAHMAKTCGATPDVLKAAAAGLTRGTGTMAKHPIPSSDAAIKKGQLYRVNIPPMTSPLPKALACAVQLNSTPLAVDVLVEASDLGPMDTRAVSVQDLANVAGRVNKTFSSNGAQKWRLPTPYELATLMPVFFESAFWGPNGADYWAATESGEALIIRTQQTKTGFTATLIAPDARSKAKPIWVR